ncbi:dUTPase [Candidatus Methylacidithermus pantelleriae]|uniref:dUTPase n=1 Tax=Candidatus Methylacidithermus pantelleriae TaxID=2744239 RepID=A0A8J2FST2_9BACT|nr:dUTPase [Candidatus Methylacidithermus pantelleriae]CAF0700927.1 dUTPase [Candidatus Methylacidithermus pantelleriae]
MTETRLGTMADKLDEIFRLQRELNLRIGVDTEKLDESGKIEWLLNYARAMSQEVAELTDCVPWKWWARYQTFNAQNAQVELVDLLHFLVSAAQVLGMTSEELFEVYRRKHQINCERQERGYREKDPQDCESV